MKDAVLNMVAENLRSDGRVCCKKGCDHLEALQVVFDSVDRLTGYGMYAPVEAGGLCRNHKSVENIPAELMRTVLQNTYFGFKAYHHFELADLPVVTLHWVCGGEVESSETVDLVDILSDLPFAPNDGELSTDLPFRTSY